MASAGVLQWYWWHAVFSAQSRRQRHRCGKLRHKTMSLMSLPAQLRHRPFQVTLDSNKVDIDSYNADAWLLSPPVSRILDKTSDTHAILVEILEKNNFVTQEFILSPLQFGLPYSRPRYYCLAKRKPLSFEVPKFNNQLFRTPGPLLGQTESTMEKEQLQSPEYWDELPFRPLLLWHNTALCARTVVGYILKSDHADIVYPHSKRYCCFTKSYYRYVKGTGSLLATVQMLDITVTGAVVAPKDVLVVNEGGMKTIRDEKSYAFPRLLSSCNPFP
ncbi:C-5 cytosine-specific DNA methylase [Datura stramonium]|uniref:C-5 cytosine-specific DNA methylase n=1 Tax=Datura stramonium TaxID=4076 RepID=A0ABS8WVN8_DATST|nr:C-5 cytosine-specific DNA methylase [Datura stramonium]